METELYIQDNISIGSRLCHKDGQAEKRDLISHEIRYTIDRKIYILKDLIISWKKYAKIIVKHVKTYMNTAEILGRFCHNLFLHNYININLTSSKQSLISEFKCRNAFMPPVYDMKSFFSTFDLPR